MQQIKIAVRRKSRKNATSKFMNKIYYIDKLEEMMTPRVEQKDKNIDGWNWFIAKKD